MEWRDIPGLEGAYQVTDTGLVRSLDRYVNNRGTQMRCRGKMLKLFINHNGYRFVRIKKRTRFVHALVLEAFVGPRPSGADTLHANDIRTDNRLENLSWGTRSQNMLDAVARGRHHQVRKTKCSKGHEYTAENTITGVSKHGNFRHCRACKRELWLRPPTPEQHARKLELQRIRRWRHEP